MEGIKFSIIVPVYNVENYIKKCINSILEQDYSNFEILVIDDGSSDSSISIVNSFEDYRIKIYKKENGGLSSARNYGVKNVSGDYIWFVDGDDYIHKNSLSLLNRLLKETKFDIVAFHYSTDTNGIIKDIKDKVEWNNKQKLLIQEIHIMK